jgi:hypothetical protein
LEIEGNLRFALGAVENLLLYLRNIWEQLMSAKNVGSLTIPILNLRARFKWTGYFQKRIKKMAKWRFFTDQESIGLTDDLCYKRDRARNLYGFPIIQTSGFRTKEQNSKVGGKSDSAHLKGLAFDMKAPADPFLREKLAWALGRAGFDRVESAPKHFHADTDSSKPTPCFFEGDDH